MHVFVESQEQGNNGNKPSDEQWTWKVSQFSNFVCADTVKTSVYVYRLCLEYARLWADDRDSMNFSL